MTFHRSLIAAALAVLVLGGCSDNTDPNAKAVASGLPQVAAPVPLEPRYAATLADGIDFRKPGYPAFVSEVTGIWAHESWGRWTVGPTATFRFDKPLPKKLKVEITANAYGPNTGQPVKVQVGEESRTFVVSSNTGLTYDLNFQNEGGANSITISPPKPTSPTELNAGSGDARKLGVGMIALKIKE